MARKILEIVLDMENGAIIKTNVPKDWGSSEEEVAKKLKVALNEEEGTYISIGDRVLRLENIISAHVQTRCNAKVITMSEGKTKAS